MIQVAKKEQIQGMTHYRLKKKPGVNSFFYHLRKLRTILECILISFELKCFCFKYVTIS